MWKNYINIKQYIHVKFLLLHLASNFKFPDIFSGSRHEGNI